MNIILARILSVCLLLFSTDAFAGLFVCNNTADKINVAVGWFKDGNWVSRGWYVVPSRQCAATLLGKLEQRYYYYYAEASNSNAKWTAKRGAEFCTSESKFYIRYVEGCVGEIFRKLDVGDDHQHTFYLSESGDPLASAANCANRRSEGADAFAKCWVKNMATTKQRAILRCVERTKSNASFAICAAAANGDIDGEALKVATCANNYATSRRGDTFLKCVANGSLSEEQARVFQCAVDNPDISDAALCTAMGELTSEQRRILGCVSKNRANYARAGLCAASGALTDDQQRVASCVLNNRGSYIQMGVCATGNSLTPEQQVFVSCAISSAGEPMTFAGCVGTQLTMNELEKCMTDGIGGSGCFGDNNTAVKIVRNYWKDVTQGPGPSNDLLGRDGWVGRKMRDVESDIRNGPGNTNDIVGKDGFVCRTLFGGC
ncbi:DUF1036 domain-containing protein [Pseudoduganella umbonata]|nr:DUF1036 domain-containing protein [Pseudoduganella umbonata]MBB3221163.1 putative membrane protein [Pseudoduganella umbonata]